MLSMENKRAAVCITKLDAAFWCIGLPTVSKRGKETIRKNKIWHQTKYPRSIGT